jgi:predicted permease
MLNNYLKIAWRTLIRNKTFSLINILGLALGMAYSLLIGLWIQDEMSVGTQYPNTPYLYRVLSREINAGKVDAYDETPGLLADELKQQFPEVEHAAGFVWWERFILSASDKVDRKTGAYAGADWFQMYSIPLLAGSPTTALSAPNNVAISRNVAEQYFGGAQAALGKAIRFNNQKDYQVSAVFDDLPANTEYKYDFLLTWTDLLGRYPNLKDWGNSGPRTRLQLRPGTDVARFEAKVQAFFASRNKNPTSALKVEYFLQPQADAYLYSTFKNGIPYGGRIQYVRLFAVVAMFLLTIAIINFMNLATARSVKRAKEVGIRKSVGAMRGLLIRQFLGESLLMTAFALIMAVLLTGGLLLPAFNELTNKQIVMPLDQAWFWAVLLGLGLLTGLLAGSYPALYLSSLNPVQVLKSTLRFGTGARTFRQGLVVFQFGLSMLFIVGTVVVYRQLNYVQTKNLGYDRESLLYMTAEGELEPKYDTFKQELMRMPGIQSVTYMQQNLTEFNNNTNTVSWLGKDPSVAMEFAHQSAGYDLVKTLKLQLRGRDFSTNYSTDSTNYLINEAAAKRIGYADALGKPLTQWGRQGTIIGVLKDFHFGSLHKPITPLIIRLSKHAFGQTIMIRTQPGQTKTALASLETVYKRINPKFPCTYQFADVEYEKLYKSETVVGTLATVFASLAIFIACLGLFGLAAFTAEQRTKEIGVRKVLGASVASVVALLSKDFLKLVLIAIVLATPLAWYVAKLWLQNFEYRVDISWWMFVLAGVVAVVIALLTVSFQSIKAALMNPVKSLRAE